MAEYGRDLRKRVLRLLDTYKDEGMRELRAISDDLIVEIEERPVDDEGDKTMTHLSVDVITDPNAVPVIGYDGPADWLRRDE